MELSSEETCRYLFDIIEISRSLPLYDLHVHPYEIFSRRTTYTADEECRGVYSRIPGTFKSPSIRKVRLDDGEAGANKGGAALMFALNAAYSSVGSGVVESQMNLSGITRSLLLPVAPPEGPVEGIMNDCMVWYAHSPNLSLAYSVPNTVADEDIEESLASARIKYSIVAVKLHPNVTGIDAGTRHGKRRIESILRACGRQNLPLIVHGGFSPREMSVAGTDYAILEKLSSVKWGNSGNAVILAHGGIYGYTGAAALDRGIDGTCALLSKYSNLFVDLSGLSLTVMATLLKRLGTERVVFGSDALYYPQWMSIVSLACALERAYGSFADGIVEIASLNPERTVFTKQCGPIS